MFRKLFISASIAVTALSAGAASAAPADAQTLHDRDHDHGRGRVRYEVLVRHRGHWDVYDTYRDLDDARRAVWQLRRQGRDARIEVQRGHW